MFDQIMLWGFVVLGIGNLVQLLFWGLMVQRLVDKLMSRNYYEYQVAKSIGAPKMEKPVIDGQPDDLRTLNEFNPY